MPCVRCQGFLVMEACCRVGMKENEMPPTVRCVNCGYIDNSVFRVNRLNFHMARILNNDTGLRAAHSPKKHYLTRGS